MAVSKIDFDSIKDAKDFIKRYSQVENFPLYGMDKFAYTYLNDEFPNGVEFDRSKLSIVGIDIEVASDDGMPDPELANKEITAITLSKNKIYYTFGCGDFESEEDNHKYCKCRDEFDLLHKFLDFWKVLDPDIVTGWHCIPENQNVWLKNKIMPIKMINNNDVLAENQIVKRKSDVSIKKSYEIKLGNGIKFETSGDHKLIVRKINPKKYTKLSFNNKNEDDLKECVLTTKECLKSQDSLFVRVPLHNNTNKDCEKYTDAQLYIAGFVYTDGSLKEKNTYGSGVNLYQSDLEMMEEIKKLIGCTTKILGPYGTNYHMSVKHSLIKEIIPLIYENYKKKLNVELLSELSKRQFLIFLSGLLDGDGYVKRGQTIPITTGTLEFCNFINDINPLQELCQWNGIFSLARKNRLRLIDVKPTHLLKKSRWDHRLGENYNILGNNVLDRNSSQEAGKIKCKKIGNDYWVKIKSITSLNKKLKMIDIETTNHKFITNGVEVHNCDLFDIPYLYNRITNLLGKEIADTLSPWGVVYEREINQKYGKGKVKVLLGIAQLDYMVLYKKFSYTPQENYRLNTVASFELNLGKIEFSGTLYDLYKTDYKKFIKYNKRDVELVDKMDDKRKFIDLVLSIAYWAKINLTDAIGTVLLWDVVIHNYLMNERNQVVPFKQYENDEDYQRPEGGYVKEPILGYHEWIGSWDFDGLYPHLIMLLNISPETLLGMRNKILSVEDLLESKNVLNEFSDSNYSSAVNGAMFSKGYQGFSSVLMERGYASRSQVKKEMLEAKKEDEKNPSIELKNKIAALDAKQQALKIANNGYYGALSNMFFRWFDTRLAEAITKTGQFCIRYMEKKINEYLNEKFETVGVDYVIASDTDSVYIKFGFKDKIIETEISSKINEWTTELFNILKAHKNVLKMKREAIAINGIWTGKKHYALNVIDNEGVVYDKPKIKITGLEVVKSSTPFAVKQAMRTAISIILNDNEEKLKELVRKTEIEFYKKPYEDVAFPRSANDLEKYSDSVTLYKKGTPIAVKGALIYNNYVKKNKFNQPLIYDGGKVKYCYLKKPNPLRSTVISTPNELPAEFKLESYIDYQTQFEKCFVGPIEDIARHRGWKLYETNTLF